jgi:hypothetical protein
MPQEIDPDCLWILKNRCDSSKDIFKIKIRHPELVEGSASDRLRTPSGG